MAAMRFMAGCRLGPIIRYLDADYFNGRWEADVPGIDKARSLALAWSNV